MKIVMSAVLALFLIGCGDGNKNETQGAESKAPVTSEAQQIQEDVEAVEEDVADVVEEDAADAQEYSKTSVEEVTKETEEVVVPVVEDVTKETEEVVVPVVEEVEAVVEDTVSEVKTEVAEVTSNKGEVLYKVCSSCHGVNGEKAALGKSQVIKGWSADKIASALNGYKVGTYGGTMKGVMIGQVSKLSPEEIKAVSEHIAKF